MAIEIIEIKKVAQFDKMEQEWTQHLSALKHLSFFMTWKWLNLWWHTFSTPSDSLKIILIKEQQELIAILPLYVKDKACIMFIGQGEKEQDEVSTEYIDIIAKKGLNSSTIQTIEKHLSESTINHFVFQNYLPNSAISQLICKLNSNYWTNTYLAGKRYIANLNTELNSTLTQFNPSLIKRLLRAKRKAETKLDMQLVNHNTQESVKQGMKNLEKTHQLRWQSKNKLGVFNSELFKYFHQHFSQYALHHHWLELNTLVINNQDIATIYCINYGNKCYFYQSGIDTTFRPNISPGYLIHILQMEKSINKSILAYDFMKGSVSGSYKKKISNESCNMYTTKMVKKSLRNLFRVLIWKVKKLRMIIANG
jgi:CelD/BcsL family acetyltransferase involved in cellulose biosynthesis